ncbi:MAG: pyroglutamyl-peptidase I [Oscillospiraceae bacterium]|jgi:pyroglutamyl-peptidase|nr:pyroglutamyl-peptidase I [Oscillospiraceae bacterium]
MKILITAFEPFGGESVNPAREALLALPVCVQGAQIVKAVIPTVFGEAIDAARRAILDHKPDAVLCVGQAGGRADMSIERVGININDARIADNKGSQPIDQHTAPDGPAAYFATLPVKEISRAMKDGGVPASISNTAGAFVCNHLMYGVLDCLARELPGSVGGFIHVPYVPEQAAAKSPSPPSMSLEYITRGLVIALETIVKHWEANLDGR